MAHALPDSAPSIFTVTFWADAIERAVGASADNMLTVLTAGAFSIIGDVPWYAVLSAGLLGAGFNLLRSLAAAGKGNVGTASFIRATKAGATPSITRFMGRGE